MRTPLRLRRAVAAVARGRSAVAAIATTARRTAVTTARSITATTSRAAAETTGALVLSRVDTQTTTVKLLCRRRHSVS